MKGREVTVLVPVEGPADRFGNPTRAGLVRVGVEDMIVQPGATADLEASRPEGASVALTLHFPKAWGGKSLRGCEVEIADGRWAGTYRVVGDPKPYDPDSTPTRWDMPVEVEACDG